MKLTTHADVKAIHDLRKEASSAGLFVVEKPDAFLLYRQATPNNLLVGKRSTLAGLRRLLRTAAAHH